ncbi:hypothetical protein [Microbacterium sp. P05]|uniref:hypothetical protein n=1 Tax=Microbacterium sp. P05 TaxID=3366948 RepID=UPI003745449C
MIDTDDSQDDGRFAAMLLAAEPPVTADTAHARKLMREVAKNVTEEPKTRPRRRVGIAASIIAPLLVIGSATAAYASTTDWSWYWGLSEVELDAAATGPWLSWAENPDAVVTYSLPGGGSCEMRMANFEFSPQPDAPAGVEFDPRSADLAREFASSTDLAALMDVESVIAENRSDENWGPVDDAGELLPFGYGTQNYDPVVEYHSAAQEAISDVIVAHLASLGVPSNGFGWQSQEICTGVDE